MKHLLKIIVVGVVIWLLSLIWLDLNMFLMSPLVMGVVVGMLPAYLLGRLLTQIYHSQTTQPLAQPFRPTHSNPAQPASELAVGPTRPNRALNRQDRAANPTRPMPVL